MSTENQLRIACAAVVIGSIGVAGYHRIQAARSGEAISRKDEGVWLFLAIRLCGLLMFIAMLSYLLAPTWASWSRFALPVGARWVGLPIGIVTIGFLYWTLSSLGKNLTDTVVTRRQHTLVTFGPYRWVRHPFYLSMLGLVVSTSMLSASWLLLVAGLATFVLLAIRVRIEEHHLLQRFGDDYARYRNSTGAFFPRLY